jgi:hypothetical protein
MAMSPLLVAIHILNILIGILSITIFALVIRSLVLTDSLILPINVKEVPRSILFWPRCGGIVDCLLFLLLWFMTPEASDGKVSKRLASYSVAILEAGLIVLFKGGEETILLGWSSLCRNFHSSSTTYRAHLYIC